MNRLVAFSLSLSFLGTLIGAAHSQYYYPIRSYPPANPYTLPMSYYPYTGYPQSYGWAMPNAGYYYPQAQPVMVVPAASSPTAFPSPVATWSPVETQPAGQLEAPGTGSTAPGTLVPGTVLVDARQTATNGQGSAPGQPAPANPTPWSASIPDGNHAPNCDLGCKEKCGPPGRIWGRAEYLLWSTREMNLPPLVTTGPASATGPILGAPGTTVLFGGDEVGDDFWRSGGRFTLGFWLNECQTKGIEASYFFLGSPANDFNAGSTGAPGTAIIGRPFFDTSTGAPGVQFVAFPGFAAGAVNVGINSSLQGADVNGICNLCCDCCYRLDLLVGPRWLQLDESITITEDITLLDDLPGEIFFGFGLPVAAGTHIVVSDRFATHNAFYGAQIGARYERQRGNFYVQLLGKLAVGVTHQTLDVEGSTTITPPGGAAVTAPGGLYALPGNIGHYARDVFTVAPEVGINVGCQATNNLRVFVGYTFLYWSNVARPGDQINLSLNSTLTPASINAPTGPPTPPLTIQGTPFWAHGINVGFDFRF
jgi:hypothetical protein